MQRFSIEKRFRDISFNDFRRTAEKLEASLKRVRPEIRSELLLAMPIENHPLSLGLGGLTPDEKEFLAKSEKHQLSDLNESLWRASLRSQLYLFDSSVNDGYGVWFGTEVRDPKKLFFFQQYLDPESLAVFYSFRRTNLSQRVGNGYHKRLKTHFSLSPSRYMSKSP